MNKKLKTVSLSLGLAGLLNTGCTKHIEDKVVSQGTIDGNKVELIQEVLKWDSDRYRLQIYDKDGNARIITRHHHVGELTLVYDDGTKVFHYMIPKK